MHTRFFEGFQGRCLSGGEARLGIAFRKCPSAATRLHQQELEPSPANAETDGGHFLTAPQGAQIGKVKEFGGTIDTNFPSVCSRLRLASFHDPSVAQDTLVD
jgi:hypothetical protein